MTIIYSCIACRLTIVCSHHTGPGSHVEAVNTVLSTVADTDDWMQRTLTLQGNEYHSLLEGGLTYICATVGGTPKSQPCSFLMEIKRRFQSLPLCGFAQTASSGALDDRFGFVLSQQMKNFSKSGTGHGSSIVSQLQSQVEEVKVVMSKNIERVLDRGERLEDLVDKSEELQTCANTFQRSSRRMSKRLWWRNKKVSLVIACIVLVVVGVLTVIILFSTGLLPVKSGDGGTDSSVSQSST